MNCPRCGAPFPATRHRSAARAGAVLLAVAATAFAAFALQVTTVLPPTGLEGWLPARWPLFLAGLLLASSLLQAYGAWHLFTRATGSLCPACVDRREAP